MFKNIPFRITVLSLFLLLSIIIITFMSYIQSFYGEKFSLKIVNNNFSLISSKVKDNLHNLDEINGFFIDTITSSFSDLKSIDSILENKRNYLEILSKILLKNKELYSTYFAFEDNSFLEIINLNIDKSLRIKYKLNKKARWLLIYINGKNTNKKNILAYDGSLNLINKKVKSNDYLPSNRPWYKKAQKNQGKTVKSKPYVFTNINTSGMTYAKRFNQKSTFAIDVLLNDFNNVLNKFNSKKSMDIFLFSRDKDLISNTKKDKDFLADLKVLLNNNKIENGIFPIASKKYILNFSKIDDEIYGYLVTSISFDEAMEDYFKYFDLILIFTVLLFLFLLPLIWYFASVIVKPVLKLKDVSKKVRNRNYSKLEIVNSRVYEIQKLSNSILEMSKAISQYQQKLEQKVEERTKELKEKNKELKRLSITDKLTNIYNRIKLEEVILEQINRSKRYKEEFGLMLIDVDYFKEVNDTFGHHVGDTTLVEIARILENNTRKSDTVGRWGGEEFIIICPHTTLKGLEDLANNIRKIIERYEFPIIGNKTASFGIAAYENGYSLEDLVNKADEALYLAKNKGRNLVMCI